MIRKIILGLFILLVLSFIFYFSFSTKKANSVYKDFSTRNKMVKDLVNSEQYKNQIETYFFKNNKFPNSNAEIENELSTEYSNISIGNNGVVIVNFKELKEVSLIWEPKVNNEDNITWDCSGINLEPKLLPSACK